MNPPIVQLSPHPRFHGALPSQEGVEILSIYSTLVECSPIRRLWAAFMSAARMKATHFRRTRRVEADTHHGCRPRPTERLHAEVHRLFPSATYPPYSNSSRLVASKRGLSA